MWISKKSDNWIIILDYILAAVFLAGILFFYNLGPSVANETSNNQNNHQAAALNIIVSRTEAQKELGLGNRASLPADEGMLFVFDHPSAYGFWMKDMSFPIDIISLDSNFVVTHIESNVSPASYPKVFYSPQDTLYVLETNAGYAENNNLKVEDALDFLKNSVNK